MHDLSPARVSHGRVLLAEDQPVNQRVAMAMLENLGYHVDVVADGAGAVEAAALTPYRAILMDCQLPVLDGYQATEAIRAREDPGRRTPIIAVTPRKRSSISSDAVRPAWTITSPSPSPCGPSARSWIAGARTGRARRSPPIAAKPSWSRDRPPVADGAGCPGHRPPRAPWSYGGRGPHGPADHAVPRRVRRLRRRHTGGGRRSRRRRGATFGSHAQRGERQPRSDRAGSPVRAPGLGWRDRRSGASPERFDAIEVELERVRAALHEWTPAS